MNRLTALTGTVKKERRRKPSAQLSAVAAVATDADPGKPVRINGPYPERRKWRIYLIDASGRKAFLFATRAEAEAMKAKLTAKAQRLVERTIGECIDAYHDYSLTVRGALRSTADSVRFHLNRLLPRDVPVAALTADRAAQLYADCSQRRHQRTGKPLSVATHHYVLLLAKGWGRWLVKTGATTANPFAAVEPVGKPKAGKPQLTRDEAQRLSQLAVERAASGDIHAVGVLLMLHMGLRQGEVGSRIARDVDHDGQVLIIPFGKTASARRRLKVPAWLQPFLRSLLADKSPSDLLFPSECQRVHHRQFWWNKVQQLCDAAAVPRVCPHSLRGLHATLAIEEGASGEAVARALGHTSFEITAKHYASPDSVAKARLESRPVPRTRTSRRACFPHRSAPLQPDPRRARRAPQTPVRVAALPFPSQHASALPALSFPVGLGSLKRCAQRSRLCRSSWSAGASVPRRRRRFDPAVASVWPRPQVVRSLMQRQVVRLRLTRPGSARSMRSLLPPDRTAGSSRRWPRPPRDPVAAAPAVTCCSTRSTTHDVSDTCCRVASDHAATQRDARALWAASPRRRSKTILWASWT